MPADIKALCAACPVRSDCLTHALRHERFGFWAGTTERQRRGLRRNAGIRFMPLEATFMNPDPAPADRRAEIDFKETA